MSGLRRFLPTLLRLGLGLVLVAASLGKIAQPQAFADILQAQGLLPARLVGLTAVLLPWLELVCGIALLVKRGVLGASAVAAVMLVAFVSARTLNALRGVEAACGCFDLDAGPAGPLTLLRDFLLAALALAVFAASFLEQGQADAGPGRPVGRP